MCFFLTLLFLGPRAVLFFWWLVDPVRWNLVFDTWLLPLVGILFVPWATLMWVLVGFDGMTGFDWVWVGLGLFIDVASYGGSAMGGRGRVGSYY